MKKFIIICFLILNSPIFSQCDHSKRIHSHNDYNNPKPLYAALENCVKSLEVDIHLVDNEILVGHDIEETTKVRTFENLYLKPLYDIIEDRDSKLSFDYELYLLIDIKSEANPTFEIFYQLLEKYDRYLTYYQNKQIHKRKVRVMISGNRPLKIINEMDYRCVFLDGRLSDINKPVETFPLISASITQVKEYLDYTEDDFIELEGFEKLITRIHNKNKCFRIWAMPDNLHFWKKQYEKGIDLINTDNVEGLSLFITNKQN